MKTFSLILAAFLVLAGCYCSLTNANYAGVFLMILGTLAYLIINMKTDKVKQYNKDCWTNK